MVAKRSIRGLRRTFLLKALSLVFRQMHSLTLGLEFCPFVTFCYVGPPTGLPSRFEQGIDLFQQLGEIDRLGMIIIAPCLDRLLTVARHGVRGQGDDWRFLGLRVGFDGLRRGPTVHHRQIHIEQDDIGRGRFCAVDALFAIVGHHYRMAAAFQAAR